MCRIPNRRLIPMFFFDYLTLCLIRIHINITIALSIATTIYTIIYLSNTYNNPIWRGIDIGFKEHNALNLNNNFLANTTFFILQILFLKRALTFPPGNCLTQMKRVVITPRKDDWLELPLVNYNFIRFRSDTCDYFF